MNQEQCDALFGPSASFSEHKEGDEIQFRQGDTVKQGKIIHVRAPGPAIIGGKEHPLLYMVDCNEGFPVKVLPSQVMHNLVERVLAYYGEPDCHELLQTKESAELMARAFCGQFIGDEQLFKVFSARVEGDAKQGKIIGLCEPTTKEAMIKNADTSMERTARAFHEALDHLGPFTGILGTYGYVDSVLRNREYAESLAANTETGEVIARADGRHLRLLRVHVEGNEAQGRVLADCEVTQGSFTACIATYGYAENGCMLSRKAAEALATNVQGQIIETEQGRLRVLSARLEGDEKAGQVMAECEAVGNEEGH